LVTVTFHNLSYDEDLRLPEDVESVVSITIEGHAIRGGMLGEAIDENKVPTAKGENIICAAVSFSGLNLVRSLTIIAGIRPDYRVEDGFMKVSLATGKLDERNKSIAGVLIESFIIGMLDLERKYKGFITVTLDNYSSKCNK
jgi:uncharacterized protein YsxB (DUF464 family)